MAYLSPERREGSSGIALATRPSPCQSPAMPASGLIRVTHLPRLAGRALVKVYRYTLSPLVGFHCRHLPTCSEYADEALERYGLWAGGWMTLARLLRCHPWGTHGIDRVPETAPTGARWYLPWRYGRWSWRNV
jgi:uncharacterized protein